MKRKMRLPGYQMREYRGLCQLLDAIGAHCSLAPDSIPLAAEIVVPIRERINLLIEEGDRRANTHRVRSEMEAAEKAKAARRGRK